MLRLFPENMTTSFAMYHELIKLPLTSSNAVRSLAVLILCTCCLPQAEAHPHVWITVKADLLFDKHNNFVAIRHQWEFDQAFAAYATVGLDKNNDGKYSRQELSKLAQINVESIADFQYFTFIRMDQDEARFDAGTGYWLEYEDGRLTLFFTLPLSEPIEPDPNTGFSDLTIEVFDPMFFAAVEFAKQDPIALYGPQNAENGCSAAVALPREMDPGQMRLLADIGPGEKIPYDLSPDTTFLANMITVTCPSP
jgi:ABC-type uncharacterized transport system substrate-binding protein